MAKYECTLPSHLALKAHKELNEDPSTRSEKLAEFAERLKKRPDLPFNKDEKFLLRFLRARKFNMEKSIELIVSYYEIRQKHPELFKEFHPSAERKVYESGFNYVLPHRDNDGCRILYLRPANWDPDQWTLHSNFRANLMSLECLLEQEETQISGVVIISDLSGMGSRHSRSNNAVTFSKYFKIMHHCYPMRIKNIHILDQPVFFTIVYNMMYPFMREKMRKRFLLHGKNRSNVLSFVDGNILPAELGGEQGHVDVTDWVRMMMESEFKHPHLWN